MRTLLITLTFLVLALLSSTASAADWPMFRHDPAHSGVADEVVEPPLELLWKYKTGNKVISSPAISGGIVYVGSYDGNVYALDATTGELKWKYKVEDNIYSSPAVSGGVVYVGAHNNDNNIYALNAETGALEWKYKTIGCVPSSPAVSNGVVYFGSWGNNVYALDAKTGAVKWNYQVENVVLSSPTVSGGVVYVGSHDSNVYALDTTTGELKWKYKTGGYVMSSPAVSGGVVYIGSDDGYVYAFAPATTTPTPTPASTPTGMPTTTSTSTPPAPTSTSTPIPTPKDTSPPAISILNPTIIEYNHNGVLEEGEKVKITYGASDPSGVASIKILLDGTMLESRNQAGTYTVTTNSLSVGNHTIRVEATDSKSNTGFEELPITVERTGPSVYFGTTRTTINKGEGAIFTLSAVNPIGNPPMTIQLILKPPSGVSVTSSSFAKAGSGIYTCTQAIESGDNVRSIEVRLNGNQAGTHEIESEVYYMFEGSSKSPTRYETLTLTIEPKHISTDFESKDQGNGLPGFAAVVAVMGLLVAACFVKRNIK